ncbi:MAG: hypothetical protein HUU37_00415 [Bdellovibrionales bacterium]|nr:hypothetical protein [Bdellovibrionales bacterium]
MLTLRSNPVLVLLILALSTPALAARSGGNGPGNGTDALAAEIAFKKLMDGRDGLSVEEKIYDLWVKAENSVPDIANDALMGRWFGLSVVNQGEAKCWPDPHGSTCGQGKKEKFRKGFLMLTALQALKMGDIEIKPRQVFGDFLDTGNFDGNMNPRDTYMGVEGQDFYWLKCASEGRSEARGDGDCLVRPIQAQSSGLPVPDREYIRGAFDREPSFHPTEYRQIGPDTIVGVRMAKTDGSKPCPDSKPIYRKETREQEVTGRCLFGFRCTYVESYEADVVDHWENASDYRVPGVCEVHYLIKTPN